jgi:hypothetical protein
MVLDPHPSGHTSAGTRLPGRGTLNGGHNYTWRRLPGSTHMDMKFNTIWYDASVGTNVGMLTYGSEIIKYYAALLPARPERLAQVSTPLVGGWGQHVWT